MATILVVDDQPVNRQFLTALLSYAGHRPIEAGDGIEALEKATAQRPDLVITDILMPNMDGVEFTQLLRASTDLPQVPVLFYTATYRVEEARSLAQSCGASMVLSKPSAPEKILAAVHEFLVLPAPQPEPAFRAFPEDPTYPSELRALALRMNTLSEEVLSAGTEMAAPPASASRLHHSLQNLQRLSLRLSNLVEVGTDLAGQRDIEKLLQGFCHAARNLGTARYAVLGVLDEGGELRLFARGLWSEDLGPFSGLRPRAGVLGRLLEERRPLRLRVGGPQDLGLPPSHPPLSSFLGVPFATPARVFGWLYLADRLGVEEFSEEDEQVISTLAIQAGMAYDNLLLCEEVQLLHEESRRRAAQLRLEAKEVRRLEEAAHTSQEQLGQLAAAFSAMLSPLDLEAQARCENRLPGAEEAVGRTGQETASPAAARSAATVLLVEDEAALRKLFASILREEGYTVLEAGRGEEALQVAAQHQGEIHLLVTDMMMPGMSGHELAEQLIAAQPELRAIYMSGYSEEILELQEALPSSEAFLQKPFKSSALLLKVRQALRR